MNLIDKIQDKIRHIQSLPEKEKVKAIWRLAIAIVAVIAAIGFLFIIIFGTPGTDKENSKWENFKSDIKEQFNNNFGSKLKIPKLEIPKTTPGEIPQETGILSI